MIIKSFFLSIRSTIQDISILASGAFISQLILLLTYPLISRLYDEQEYGVFSVFLSITGVLGLLSSLRFDTAIPLPKQEKSALALLKIAICLSFIISTIFFFIALLLNGNSLPIDLKISGRYLFLVPISVIFMSLLLSLNYLLVRHQDFVMISKLRVIQTLTTSSIQIIFGIISISFSGLVFGTLMGQIIALFYVIKQKFISVRKSFGLQLSSIKKEFIEYQRFPKYSLPGSFANASATELPLIFIASNFSLTLTGIYGMAFRLLNLPISLISGSVNQVILSNIAISENNDSFNIRAYIIKVFLLLLSLSIIFFLIIFFFGPFLFSLFLGERWIKSGELATILIVSISLKFCISPLSAILNIQRNLKIQFLWQAFFLLSMILLIAYSYIENLTFSNFIIYLVTLESIIYLLMLFLILRYSNKN